jgi:hypothetical protein
VIDAIDDETHDDGLLFRRAPVRLRLPSKVHRVDPDAAVLAYFAGIVLVAGDILVLIPVRPESRALVADETGTVDIPQRVVCHADGHDFFAILHAEGYAPIGF